MAGLLQRQLGAPSQPPTYLGTTPVVRCRSSALHKPAAEPQASRAGGFLQPLPLETQNYAHEPYFDDIKWDSDKESSRQYRRTVSKQPLGAML